MGLILEANLTAATLLGVPRGGLVKQVFSRFIHKEDVGTYYLHRKQLFESGEPQACELRIVTQGGANLWAHLAATAAQDDRGAPVCRMVLTDITSDKQAAEALAESESKFRAVFENAPECVKLLDCEGRLLEMNPAGLAMLQATMDQVRGEKAVDLVAEEDQAAFAAMVEAVFRGETRQLTCDMIGMQGRRLTLETTGVPLQGPAPGGAVKALLGVMRDVTERSRTEAAMREMKSLLRAILQAAADGILAISNEGKVLYANDCFAELWRMPPALFSSQDTAKMLEHVLDQLVDPQDTRQKIQERYKSQAISFDILYCKDGRVFEQVSHPLMQGATLCGRVVSFRDVSERRRLEAELRESDEKYRVIFEGAAEGIAIADAATERLLYANPAYCKMYGYTQEELFRLGVADLHPKEAVSTAIAEFEAQTGAGWKIIANLPCLRKDGTVFYADISSQSVVLAGRRINAGFFTDVTERRRFEAEREKLEAQNRLLQKSESLSRMAGAIAHTFNNQLQAAMLNLEFAMEARPQNAELAESLTGAMEAVRRAAEASGLMLTYVGQSVGKRAPVDLSEVCQRSVTLVRAGMPKSVILEADLPAPGPTIKADANQIQQALTNLLANAWEACGGRGGAIHLRVREVAAADIPASHRFPVDSQLQDGRYACVELADTGCGIAEEDIEKVFDPFFSTKFTGRGIGLAVVVGVLRGHGGVATVESKLGVGTVFRVFLPIAPEAVLPQSISVAPLPKASRSGMVLVVDDDLGVRSAAASVLRREGFAVLTARDGLEAVAVFRAQQQEIRLVLCDLTMPRMGGWETLAAVRKLVPGIPVILASGYSVAQVMEGEHAELPQAVLSKPYPFETLMTVIDRVLGGDCQ